MTLGLEQAQNDDPITRYGEYFVPGAGRQPETSKETAPLPGFLVVICWRHLDTSFSWPGLLGDHHRSRKGKLVKLPCAYAGLKTARIVRARSLL